MGIADTIMGTRSTRDKKLPYTYEAWVDILDGQGREPLFDHYLSSTLCGLIDYLDEKGIRPGDVRLNGVYRGKVTRLSSRLCSKDGVWLKRPELCRSLEQHYCSTHDEAYRGHVEKGPCSFEDRERGGMGPVW